MPPPAISAFVLRFFRGIVRGYLRRHFHAVRISGAERFVPQGEPLIVYLNHASWWDPMAATLVSERLMPVRLHYAPMEAAALARYGILGRIGVFPVERNTTRGAAQFLRTGAAVLDSGGVLWVTPQGRFVDVRARPLDFKPGLAALAARVAASSGSCTLLPLAIEYTFWDERLPECLLRFGQPVRVGAGQQPVAVKEIDARLTAALGTAMDELQALALARDPTPFQVLATGRSGAGGFYAIGQRIRAFALRRPYQADHTAPAPAPEAP